MLHTASFFAYLFPLALILERVRSRRVRVVLLVAANCVFLASIAFSVLLAALGVTVAVWATALLLGRLSRPSARNATFLAALCMLGAIVFFKASSLSPEFSPLVGISFSFFCLPLIGYLADVWSGKLAPERNPVSFAAFATYFPVILSGPVTRAQNFLPQIEGSLERSRERLAEGAELVLRGLFKKLLLADRLIDIEQAMLQAGHGGQSLLLAPHFHLFMVRTYFDFSGYTDIARGVSLCFGFELPVNFDRPFVAVNPIDFWRRWHVSFSQWLRDYLYYPLFFTTKRLHLCFLVTFLCNGLWHSLQWNFLFLGLFWSAMVSGYLVTKPWWDRLPGWGQVVLMWQIFAASFIFFEKDGIRTLQMALSGSGSLPAAAAAVADKVPGIILWLLLLAVYQALKRLLASNRGNVPIFLALVFVVICFLYGLSIIGSPGYIYSQF